MHRAPSIALEVVAGFFFYTALLVVFVGGLPVIGNLGLFTLFAVLSLATLLCGLALVRFQRWKRDAGIVIILSSLMSLFVIMTGASMLATREFREMATPDSIQLFKQYHYVAGSIVMCALTLLGATLTIIDKKEGTTPKIAAGRSTSSGERFEQ